MMDTKICRDCGVAKLLIEFHPRPLSRSKDGRDTYCIYCSRARCAANYQRTKESRKVKRLGRVSEQTQYNRAYYAKNCEKLLEANREYHKAHAPAMAVRKRQWRSRTTSV